MSSVLIADNIDKSGRDYLKQNGLTVDEKFDITPEQLASTIFSYDALVVRGRSKVTRDIIGKGTRLKVIARAGTGVDNIDMDAAREYGKTVINARGANAEAVAEHTLAFILMLARNMFKITSSMHNGGWEKASYQAFELEGKTLGVIGLGTIGYRVAQFARTLGMAVVSYSRTTGGPKSLQIETLGGRFVTLDELFKLSDFISVHVPLTPETTRLIGAAQFAIMKPEVFFINTSRGEVVDEQALTQALISGNIAGAALDVFGKEPLAADSPLRTLPNVILTPHVASVSREGSSRISRMIAGDVVRVLTGKAPEHLVQ